MSEQTQVSFRGWAIVEVMGHQRYAGYVTTEVYGAATLFRIDVPALPEMEEELRTDRYINGQMYLSGSKFKVDPVDGYSKLIGAGAIFAITPCTEEAARIDTFQHSRASRPLIPVVVRQRQLLESPERDEPDNDDSYDPNAEDL